MVSVTIQYLQYLAAGYVIAEIRLRAIADGLPVCGSAEWPCQLKQTTRQPGYEVMHVTVPPR